MELHLETASRDALIDHIDELQGRIDALSQAIGLDSETNISVAFGLSKTQTRILMALADGKARSKEAILSLAYFDRHDDEPELKIIDVMICKIRAKLAGFGLAITTHWGAGYQVGPEVVAAIAKASLGEAPTLVGEDAMPPLPRKGRDGTPQAAHGDATRAALAVLRRHADPRGQVRITSRDLAVDAKLRCAGSTMIRNLEGRAYIEVKVAPPPGSSGNHLWVLHLTDARR